MIGKIIQEQNRKQRSEAYQQLIELLIFDVLFLLIFACVCSFFSAWDVFGIVAVILSFTTIAYGFDKK